MTDETHPRVEYLDEWDAPQPPGAPRGGTARILIVSAVVLVVAVLIALGLGLAQRRAVAPLTSAPPLPTAPSTSTGGPTDQPSTYQVSTDSPTAYQSLEVLDSTPPADTPSPLPSDIESDPLTIKLLDKVPKVGNGTIAYNLSVCVNSASSSIGGGKVRIVRSNWSLGTLTTGTAGPADGMEAAQPAFPVQGLYGKGECASGYVTFALSSDTPIFLTFLDDRFGWYWMLG